jgi:glutamyl-tRNA synthetase
MKVRTRFAPSPTGYLHIGAIRTALYCYALAHRHQGQYILRVEDTDRNRYVEAGLEEIYIALKAYGVEPDESDRHGGNYGPYTQSKRLDLYQKYARELVEKGAAYYCFLNEEESEQLRTTAQADRQVFRSPYRDLSLAEADAKRAEFEAAGKLYVVRQKMPVDRVLTFTDGVQGNMSFNTNDVDDGVLLKSDGFPTYHLAMLVDDHLMEITHVFRGFEWIPSIPKHILLYEAMEWEMPQLFHMSVILDPEGGKLSKRKGATAAMEFLAEGYLPGAVLNFLMFLGWSSPLPRVHGEAEREIYSLEEFVEIFDTKDLNKSNPVFNREKLLWFNQKYIANADVATFTDIFKQWVEKHYNLDDQLKAAILNDVQLSTKLVLVKDRAKLLAEIPTMLKFFYAAPATFNWQLEQLKRVDQSHIKELLTKLHQIHLDLGVDAASWQHPDWEQPIRALADAYGYKHGDVFMVLRLAIVGEPFSPPLFECLQMLGSTNVTERIQRAIERI